MIDPASFYAELLMKLRYFMMETVELEKISDPPFCACESKKVLFSINKIFDAIEYKTPPSNDSD